MPSAVIATDTIGSVNLNANNQFALITPTGVLRYGFGDAIQLNANNVRVQNDGAIYSFNDAGNGRAVAMFLLRGGPHVILNHGTIAADGEGLYYVNFNLRLANTGSITGETGVSIGGGTISNSGLIAGDSTAAFIARGTTVNSGQILGGDTGLALDTGVQTGFTSIVRNTGTIAGVFAILGPADVFEEDTPNLYVIENAGSLLGNVRLGLGIDRLTNQGTIQGEVSLQAGNDTFFNRGTLVGGVSMGEGADNYVGSRGSATGLVAGDAGDDQLIAGLGGDTLDGGLGNDALYGGDQGDNLLGGTGNDELYGQGGNDFLVPGAGTDVVDGGDGLDWISHLGAAAGVVVDLSDETRNTGEAADDQIDGIEFVYGSLSADQLRGTAGFNRLTGEAGNDRLDGAGGADVLRGNADNDTYLVDAARDRIIERAGFGTDTVLASTSFRLLPGVSVEVLQTTLATGTTALDLTGNAIGQAITGNNGANRLSGLAGNDTLVGGAGNDRLDGGGNDDTLTGGAGADRFVLALGFGTDTITDFSVADDTIEIAAQRLGLVAGPLAPGAFRMGTAALDANDRLLYDPSTGRLIADVNGSAAGGTQLQLTLTSRPTGLTVADFLLI